MTNTNTAAANGAATKKPTAEEIMEQAQVFASTWSLVGKGAFGVTIEEANAEKAALETMLRAALVAPAQPAAQALDAWGGERWLTVVYRDVASGDEARQICEHPKASAMSWSHALNDRDAAIAAQQGGANG